MREQHINTSHPPEMGNMVLIKVENWEKCQALCLLVSAGVETEMEIVAQRGSTVTGRQVKGEEKVMFWQ